VHFDAAIVRKWMGVVALAVPSQLGAASPSAGDSRRYNGGSVQMCDAGAALAFRCLMVEYSPANRPVVIAIENRK
jgi:hypothetical protein